MTTGIVLVIVFNDNKTGLLIIVALTTLVACFVALFVLFIPKIYLSLISKEALVRQLQVAIDSIYAEISVKERQVRINDSFYAVLLSKLNRIGTIIATVSNRHFEREDSSGFFLTTPL